MNKPLGLMHTKANYSVAPAAHAPHDGSVKVVPILGNGAVCTSVGIVLRELCIPLLLVQDLFLRSRCMTIHSRPLKRVVGCVQKALLSRAMQDLRNCRMNSASPTLVCTQPQWLCRLVSYKQLHILSFILGLHAY